MNPSFHYHFVSIFPKQKLLVRTTPASPPNWVSLNLYRVSTYQGTDYIEYSGKKKKKKSFGFFLIEQEFYS